MKKRYIKWIKNNIDIKGKKALVTGATGSLGTSLSRYILLSGADLVISGRDQQRTDELSSLLSDEYKDRDISSYICDYSSFDDVRKLVSYIDESDIDILFLNAGMYHQKESYVSGIERTFFVNALMPYYIATRVKKNLTIVYTGSISYKFSELDTEDLDALSEKNLTKRYGRGKRACMAALLSINKDIRIAHPGISTTNLFSRRNKAYNKAFYLLAVPIMKVIFMSPEKASLSLISPLMDKDRKKILYGPRGMFHCFGYPGRHSFKKMMLDADYQKRIREKMEEMIFSLSADNQKSSIDC